jgi:hypothetical protein
MLAAVSEQVALRQAFETDVKRWRLIVEKGSDEAGDREIAFDAAAPSSLSKV